jgi:hypothetical protein
MAVQEELARGALVFRDIEFPALVCTHGIASRLDAARGNVVSLIRQSMASLVNCGMWPGVSQLHAPELSTEPGPRPYVRALNCKVARLATCNVEG